MLGEAAGILRCGRRHGDPIDRDAVSQHVNDRYQIRRRAGDHQSAHGLVVPELRDDVDEPVGQLRRQLGQVGIDGARDLGDEGIDIGGHPANVVAGTTAPPGVPVVPWSQPAARTWWFEPMVRLATGP
jgi:hypothetical protein